MHLGDMSTCIYTSREGRSPNIQFRETTDVSSENYHPAVAALLMYQPGGVTRSSASAIAAQRYDVGPWVLEMPSSGADRTGKRGAFSPDPVRIGQASRRAASRDPRECSERGRAPVTGPQLRSLQVPSDLKRRAASSSLRPAPRFSLKHAAKFRRGHNANHARPAPGNLHLHRSTRALPAAHSIDHLWTARKSVRAPGR